MEITLIKLLIPAIIFALLFVVKKKRVRNGLVWFLTGYLLLLGAGVI